MQNLRQDARFGLRLLRKSPLFSAIAVIVLALGIGANTAVFSVVDAVLLHKLPFRDPDRLVMVWEKNPALGPFIADRIPTSYSTFTEWVRQSHSFESIAGFEDASLNRTGVGDPERLAGARVSPNFFNVLGVTPALGTSFDYVEHDPSRARVAILGNAYWQSHFGANNSVIGQTLTLNDISYTVIGVLPAQFHLPATREGVEQRKPDIWIPYDPTEQHTLAELNRRRMQVFARLAPGVSLEQARSEMNNVGQHLQEEYPQLAGFGVNVFPVYVEDVGKDLRRNLLVLLAAVGLVLLIACANLANLMLTRATARQKELAIRKALGASRARLITQMVVESLVLSFLGGILAIALAHFGIKALLAMKPSDIQRPEQIHIGLAVLMFTMGVSVIAGIVFGALPALHVSSADVNTVLKDSMGGPDRHPGRMRASLVVGEVSLAFVLLIGAAFMIRSLLSVLSVDPGFRPDHLLTMRFSLPSGRYSTNDQFAGFCRQLLERIDGLPGVKAASFADGLPMMRLRTMRFTVEGQPAPEHGAEPTADMRGITAPAYFDTLGIPIVGGRNFTGDELDKGLPVIIVNRTLAKRLWPHDDAVGKHISTVPTKADAPPVQLTVIGISGDTHQLSLESGARPEIHRPMQDYTNLTLAVRSSSDPTALTAAIKNQVHMFDKDLPVYDVATMEQVLDDSTGQRRFNAFLMGIFGGLALVLAAVGIYGVLASTVEQRTQEIGIRMALGARPGNVLTMVLHHGLRLVAIGIVLGLVVGFALTRLLSSLLFGVSPANPATYISVCVVMTAVAALACYLPARRAVKVDPMRALRHE